MPEELKCNLCRRKWLDIPEASREQYMMFHMLTEHPMEFLGHPKVQNVIGGFFEHLGEMLADKLKEKSNG